MADELSDSADALQGLTSQMARLDTITTQFGRSLARAMSAGIVQGRSFDDILRGLGQRLIEISLRAAFKPLETGISGMLNGLVSSVTGIFTGNGFGTSSLVSGLFGERGMSSGAPLFGSFANGAPAASGITVNMAVNTPDAESFKRSEAQVSAALARAVSRGQRSL